MKFKDTKDELVMQHALLKHLGETIVGPPEGPFAVYDAELKAILVFGARSRDVRHTSLTGNATDSLLHGALRMRAAFQVSADGQVMCRIGEFEATADSYAEAALKAITQELDSREASGQTEA